MENAKDMDGESRTNGAVDIGADEYWSGALTGALSLSLSMAYTQAVVGTVLPFEAQVTGRAQSMVWDFGDGTRVTNLFDVFHAFTNWGIYSVTLTVSNLSGQAGATAIVHIVKSPTYYYVATNGNDLAAGTNWTAAKATIQTAIDAAIPGDTVWVNKGVYAAGGTANYPAGSRLTNRVAVYKPITVRSVHGPFETFITGHGPKGDTAVRCVYLTDGARLEGFTLINGHTRIDGDSFAETCGGGLWGELDNAVISNCFFIDNVADDNGGGACRGILYNCMFMNNTADFTGGGACGSVLYNCTLTGNSAVQGGGTFYGTLNNCIVYYNNAAIGVNWYEGTFDHTCATPLPSGIGNFTNEPGIVGVNHPFLLASSPCINAGINQSWMPSATDTEGEPRINGISDVGADEYWGNSLTGALSVAISVAYSQAVVSLALPFEARITGQTQGYIWDFGDGMRATNLCRFTHAYASSGIFSVTLTASNLSGSAATAVTVRIVNGANYYVATNGNDLSIGDNWAAAKATIQAAIDVAIPGATVWVSNGLYATGGATNYPAGSGLTNRVAIYKPIIVRSVNGPSKTSILGRGPCSAAAIRCVFMTAHARLIGFTLADGHTWTNGNSTGGPKGASGRGKRRRSGSSRTRR
jgi:PKD repeat protein